MQVRDGEMRGSDAFHIYRVHFIVVMEISYNLKKYYKNYACCMYSNILYM